MERLWITALWTEVVAKACRFRIVPGEMPPWYSERQTVASGEALYERFRRREVDVCGGFCGQMGEGGRVV